MLLYKCDCVINSLFKNILTGELILQQPGFKYFVYGIKNAV
jgi:hypothetical protein